MEIVMFCAKHCLFLLTPLREGRPLLTASFTFNLSFLLTPLREGRRTRTIRRNRTRTFLLTPLREGRRLFLLVLVLLLDFYSRPCGRGDPGDSTVVGEVAEFLLTPLREGRPIIIFIRIIGKRFLLTPLREGRPVSSNGSCSLPYISTHAPAGGATAIFHKSVMRFCGKLPKDDTVLCLASFGFPRRDPKAVYLAWISCANLPQKCVRQGLALKDQGTSCFHEGLASHTFDPVLV